MEITVNGLKTELEKQMDIASLLDLKKIHPQAVVIELNGKIINRNTELNTALQNGDTVEIVHFVGGG
jgi:thiamine biosynthesis protein ThiS